MKHLAAIVWSRQTTCAKYQWKESTNEITWKWYQINVWLNRQKRSHDTVKD